LAVPNQAISIAAIGTTAPIAMQTAARAADESRGGTGRPISIAFIRSACSISRRRWRLLIRMIKSRRTAPAPPRTMSIPHDGRS
jgi:hypothetical protein